MKLMVLDGNSIVNRAFYGVSQNLITRSGQPTNAIFGFLNILNKLTDDERPDALCVTFDRPAPTFRHLKYKEYKSNRKGMPDELASQMPILKQILSAMNIPTYELDGWEADDLLGTIARIDTEAGWDTVIVTGDRDSLQLVSDRSRVNLVKTAKGRTETTVYTPDVFREEYGFDPIHLIDLKGLMGDTSDCIPGIRGVGEKTAKGLIQVYQTVETLYEHMPDILPRPDSKTKATKSLLAKLEAGKEDAFLSKDLATIHTDAPISFRPQDNLCKEPNQTELYRLFLSLEFAKLIDKYHLTPATEDVRETQEFTGGPVPGEVVTSPERARDLLALWRQAAYVSVLALPSLDAICVVRPGESGSSGALLFADQLENYNAVLSELFSPGIRKITHGVKTLSRRLLEEGITPGDFVFDTEVAAYLLAPTDGSYELEKLGMVWYNREFPKSREYLDPGVFDSMFGISLGGNPDVTEESGELPAPMAALLSHTSLILALRDTLTEQLQKLGMWDLFEKVELPLCSVLAEMEMEGFLIDRDALAAFGEMLSENIDTVQAKVFDLAGDEQFNINSTQQLGRILFEKLKLPPERKTARGWSTNADVLEKLRGKHPIIEAILEYRQLTKLKSTYVDGLTRLILPNGRIHTTFQNTVTATGRLSSTDPNLQNIPVRTPLGAEMRRMFVAPAGKVLVDADYSQIELRLLACIAGDQSMIDGFNSGEDVHAITASQVFGVPFADVTPEMRRSAKAVNFGIVYGISPFSLSQDIGVTVNQAKEYMEKYFQHYAGVRSYMNDIVVRAKADGYVSTLYGRRRWLPELRSTNYNTRSFGERVALNAPIQGTAADIMKIAMLRVRNRLQAEGLQGRLILQVHDELIVECPEAEAETVSRLLKEEMESAVTLQVPLIAETHSGHTWADAH